MTTAERLTAVAENVKKVYEAGVRDGFIPPESEYLTPEYIYKTTRPGDWLTMPTPGNDEMYFLLHLPADADGYFAATITFTTCVLDFGTVVNGEFVSVETATPTSGVRFKKTIDHTKYGNVTADGWKQCMIRAKGTMQNVYLRKESDPERNIFVKDFICGTRLNVLRLGDNDYPVRGVVSLCYARFVGSGEVENPKMTFAQCWSLRMVSCEKKATHNYAINYIANNCNSLEFFSDNMFADTSDNKTVEYTFQGTALKENPTIRIPLTYCGHMFRNSSRLQVYDGSRVNTAKATVFTGMFYGCYPLTRVLNLDISSATNTSDIFYFCNALERVTFAGETTPGGFTITIANKCLSHDAIVDMIASLPTATASATITLTNTTGASALTDAEIAVATAKNWTITR